MTSPFEPVCTADDFKESVAALGFEIQPTGQGLNTRDEIDDRRYRLKNVAGYVLNLAGACILLSACCHLLFGWHYSNHAGLILFALALISLGIAFCLSMYGNRWGPQCKMVYKNSDEFINDCPDSLKKLFTDSSLKHQFITSVFYYRPAWKKKHSRMIIDIMPNPLSVGKGSINAPKPWSFSLPTK